MTKPRLISISNIPYAMLLSSPANSTPILSCLLNLFKHRRECKPRAALYINPGELWISKQTHQSVRAVSRGLQTLIRRGFVRTTQYHRADGTWTTNIYRLTRRLLNIFSGAENGPREQSPTATAFPASYCNYLEQNIMDSQDFKEKIRSALLNLQKIPHPKRL